MRFNITSDKWQSLFYPWRKIPFYLLFVFSMQVILHSECVGDSTLMQKCSSQSAKLRGWRLKLVLFCWFNRSLQLSCTKNIAAILLSGNELNIKLNAKKSSTQQFWGVCYIILCFKDFVIHQFMLSHEFSKDINERPTIISLSICSRCQGWYFGK